MPVNNQDTYMDSIALLGDRPRIEIWVVFRGNIFNFG